MTDVKDIKIIGLGLPKTGTTSLARGCEILGVPEVWHMPLPIMEAYRRTGVWSMGEAGAVFGINPWPAEAMHRAYPGAYFIHGHRPLDTWVESAEAHFIARPHQNSMMRLEIFGVYDWSLDAFVDAWHYHKDRMVAFIDAPGVNGLHFQIGGHGWPELCEFLGVPVPSMSFPHLNERQ